MELIFKLKGLNMICNVKYLHKKKQNTSVETDQAY